MIDPLFLAFLAPHDDQAWLRIVDRLGASIHPVDRAATRVWMHLYPLRLQRALEEAADPAALAGYLRLQGEWRLSAQRETSHWFLFGHRFWPEVREAVLRFASRPAAPGSLDLGAQVQEIAREAAARLSVDASWLVGITAVAVRVLQQCGLPDAAAAVTTPLIGAPESDPDRIVASRDAEPRRGLLQRLRGGRRHWTVTFDERAPRREFPLIDTQHLTTAAALDQRDYRGLDPRCSEGPIPVHCRSCSCGTCWVGVLSGADRLSPMDSRERSTLAALGYADTSEAHPQIRLACMAEARGPVTIVIPPWNGQIGARLARAAGVQ